MKIILAVVLMSGTAAALAEDSGLRLTKDPFRQPILEEIIEDALPDEIVLVESEPKPIPELRGILRSSRETLINLNGELVTVGGHFEGFTVASVGERTAVLLDGDEQYVVSLDDEQAGSHVAR